MMERDEHVGMEPNHGDIDANRKGEAALPEVRMEAGGGRGVGGTVVLLQGMLQKTVKDNLHVNYE